MFGNRKQIVGYVFVLETNSNKMFNNIKPEKENVNPVFSFRINMLKLIVQ